MRAAATVLLSSLLGAASVLATGLPSAPFDISSLAARQAPPPPPPGCQNNQSRLCWDANNNIDTNYYTSGPRTGRIVDVSFRIQNVTLAPDGRSRTYLTVNGQMPGPTIVANWGDTIRVTVKNELQHNGTSIHWHGVRMLRNFLNDGVNGVGECALAPNDTKVYTFIAEQYGTTWYHSHFSAQYGDGVWGPIVINGPATAEYDIDLGPVTLSENFWPLTAFQSAYVAERTGPPAPQNFLVNGVNVNPTNLTQGTRHKITFTPGKKHRLRFINTSVDQFFRVSLDGHSMQVIQSDFVPIVPYNTTSVGIAIGQRYDVIINADQTAGTYWLRTWAICGGNANNGNGTANAYVRYSTATDVLPTTTAQTVSTAGCVDETTIVPRVPITVDSSAFPTNNTIMGVSAPSLTNVLGSNVFRWSIAGGLPMKVQLGNPSVLVLKNGQTMAADMNSVFINGANTTAYWVIQNLAPIPHPIHLHLHDFNVVARGAGTYNSSTAVHTWVNPPRRDVAMLPPNGYLMIAFKADNPGLGIMHCHIAWHVAEGLSLQLVERQAEMLSGTTLSAAWNTTCSRWNTWEASAANVYAPLSDSGLRRRAEIDAF